MIQSLQDCLQGMEQQQQSSNASKFVHSIAESITHVFQQVRVHTLHLHTQYKIILLLLGTVIA